MKMNEEFRILLNGFTCYQTIWGHRYSLYKKCVLQALLTVLTRVGSRVSTTPHRKETWIG